MAGEWNPVEALKAQYPNMGLSDQQIMTNLQDPEKFRSAFPQFQVSDDDVHTNMGKFALRHPEYGTPSAATSHTQIKPVDVLGNPQTEEAATAGLPGMTGNRPVTDADLIPGAIAGGVAGTIMGGPVLRAAAVPVAKQMAKHPLITMGAIEAAKHLPGPLGRIAGSIPSWLPLLIGGHGEPGAAPELDATGENRPFAGGTDEYIAPKSEILDATGENKPFAGGMDEHTPKPIIPSIERIEAQTSPLDRLRNQEVPPAVDYTPPRPNIERIMPPKSQGQQILDKMRPFAEKIEAEGHGPEPSEPEETSQKTLNQNEDLTPALKKSLAKVRARKGTTSGTSTAQTGQQ